MAIPTHHATQQPFADYTHDLRLDIYVSIDWTQQRVEEMVRRIAREYFRDTEYVIDSIYVTNEYDHPRELRVEASINAVQV